MTQPLVDEAYVLDPEDPRAPTEAQWERMEQLEAAQQAREALERGLAEARAEIERLKRR